MDTSALMLLFTQHSGFPAASAALAHFLTAEPMRVLTSVLTITELRRNVVIRLGAATQDEISGLFERIDLIPLDVYQANRAGMLQTGWDDRGNQLSLRSADAIHIAAALDQGCDRFISYDRQQVAAARFNGLICISPGAAPLAPQST